jgi:hypothetical protein
MPNPFRARARHAARVVSIVGIFVAAGALAATPDLLGIGFPENRPNDDGTPAAVGYGACGNSGDDTLNGGGGNPFVVQLINFLLGVLPGSTATKFCGVEKYDITTGVAVAPPPPDKLSSAGWSPMIGGQGRTMADATLCMMKDFLALPNARVDHWTQDSDPIIRARTEQIVGLQSFDPNTKTASLYHIIRACAPVIGCIDVARQTITAHEIVNAPAWPDGLRAGDYPIIGEYAIQTASDWSSTTFHATLPSVDVDLPYGHVSAKPELNFNTKLIAADFVGPIARIASGRWDELNYPTPSSRVAIESPLGAGTSTPPIADTYGFNADVVDVETHMPDFGSQPCAQPGCLFPVKNEPPTAVPLGWSSQLGFGARNGDQGVATEVWHGSADLKNPSERPEINLTIPRAPREIGPVAHFMSQAPITYTADLTDLVKPVIGPAAAILKSLTVTVQVNPVVQADYAAQLGLIVRDAQYDQCARNSVEVPLFLPCNLSETAMPMQARASALAEVNGFVQVDIELKWPIPSPGSIHLDFPGYPVSHGSSGSDEIIYRTVRLTDGRPDNTVHTDYRVDAAGQQSAPLEPWISDCMKPPQSVPPPPAPHRDPPINSVSLPLLPCNLCLAAADNAGHGFNYTWMKTSTTYSTASSWTCTPANSGCYDMCTWDPAKHQMTAAVVSAIDLFHDRCMRAPG